MSTATLTTPATGRSSAGRPAASELQVRCKIADSQTAREAAYRLIYNTYVDSGLSAPNAHGMRVTPYHLLPTTTVFNAYLNDSPDHDPLATVSLVLDGELGLPMEAVYPEEIAQRLSQGLRIAEVSCLAERRRGERQFQGREFFSVFCQLNRLMIQFARSQQVDHVLVAVHPRHARFYTRYMGFREIAGLTAYPSVQNRPAVALCFDFAHNDAHPFPFYDRFFSEPLPTRELRPQPISAEERLMHSRMIDPSFEKPARSNEELPASRRELLGWITRNELKRQAERLLRSA